MNKMDVFSKEESTKSLGYTKVTLDGHNYLINFDDEESIEKFVDFLSNTRGVEYKSYYFNGIPAIYRTDQYRVDTVINDYLYYIGVSKQPEQPINYNSTYRMFSKREDLISLDLSKWILTSIGHSAFYSCTSLTSITIPDSVKEIGDYAFNDCTSLESITIPDSVKEIGECVFECCTSLESIEIPDSVKTIGDYAFYDCSSLESIKLPDSVTSIGDRAFVDCTSLETIEIPDSVKTISDYVFYGCTNLTSITIPSSVKEIGDWAFYNCTSLETVEIGSSTVLKDNTFSKSVEIVRRK